MSIENEYLSLKQSLKTEEKKLLEYQAIEITEDENNPFSTEERINAKNRCITSCKESISELKEILVEVEDELRDFIANGGEVSEITLKELKDEESSNSNNNDEDDDMKTIYFKIQMENTPVSVEGYVEVSKTLEDEGEWYFWNGSQYNNRFTMNHEEIIISSNKSDFDMDFDEFETKYMDNIDFINEIVLTAEENENETYSKNGLQVHVGE